MIEYETHPGTDSFIPFVLYIGFDIGPHTGERAKATVNADGSVTVSDWALVEHYATDHMTLRSQEFGIVTLLLAARGHIREVDQSESEEIARRAFHHASKSLLGQ